MPQEVRSRQPGLSADMTSERPTKLNSALARVCSETMALVMHATNRRNQLPCEDHQGLPVPLAP